MTIRRIKTSADLGYNEYGVVVFGQCGCRVWPLYSPIIWGVRRCGFCGAVPFYPVPATPDGRTRLLTADDLD